MSTASQLHPSQADHYLLAIPRALSGQFEAHSDPVLLVNDEASWSSTVLTSYYSSLPPPPPFLPRYFSLIDAPDEATNSSQLHFPQPPRNVRLHTGRVRLWPSPVYRSSMVRPHALSLARVPDLTVLEGVSKTRSLDLPRLMKIGVRYQQTHIRCPVRIVAVEYKTDDKCGASAAAD